MGDPKWNKRLTPIQNKAVTYLSGDLAPLLDSLLSKGLLGSKKYKKMIQTLKDETKDEEVARDLLLELVERPAPSFDEFVDVLEEYVEKNPGSTSKYLLKLLKDVDVTKTKASSEGYSRGLGATSNLERCPENGEISQLSAKLSATSYWWKQVARKLKMNEGEILEICMNYRDTGEQAKQMLRCWKNKNGPSATVACLCRALMPDTQIASVVFRLSDAELASLQK